MPLLLAFVADLMFTTRIAKVVEHLGYRVEWIETCLLYTSPSPRD